MLFPLYKLSAMLSHIHFNSDWKNAQSEYKHSESINMYYGNL